MLTSQKKASGMMTGVIILMAASMVEKVLGVVFKIPLYNFLGNVGMGYFNAAYSIFSTFYTISLTGFPIAVSIMVSKSSSAGRKREVGNIFIVELLTFVIIGLIGSLAMFFGSGIIADLIDNQSNSSQCIKAIAPILFIICVSGSIKGYFQGHRNMKAAAVSELLDALGKSFLGIVFALNAYNAGMSSEICAMYALIGVTSGHLLGLLFLILYKTFHTIEYQCDISEESSSKHDILKTLFSIAVPITLSSIALGLMSNIDTFTIMNCLKSDNAMAKYGAYTTLAVTLFRLPQAFILPISSALTPTLSSTVSSGDKDRSTFVMRSALKLMSIIAMPCTFGMSIFAYPIIYFLFGNSSSADTIKESAPYLSILSLGIFFMAILTITSSILQSHKFEKKPMISTLLGAVTKFVLNIALVSTIGIVGAPISSVIGYFIMSVTNLFFVIKYVYPELNIINIISKSFYSSIIMGALSAAFYCLITYIGLETRMALILTIIVAIMTYIITLLCIHGIDKDDIMLIPGGEKIYTILYKLHLMK